MIILETVKIGHLNDRVDINRVIFFADVSINPESIILDITEKVTLNILVRSALQYSACRI